VCGGAVRCAAVRLGGCVADELHVRDDAAGEAMVRKRYGAAKVDVNQAQQLELAW
jgi:hypothetical protein